MPGLIKAIKVLYPKSNLYFKQQIQSDLIIVDSPQVVFFFLLFFNIILPPDRLHPTPTPPKKTLSNSNLRILRYLKLAHFQVLSISNHTSKLQIYTKNNTI